MRAKRNTFRKIALVLLALVLVVGGTIGGTLAYLATKTEEVTNTFTASDITITLTESENLDLKMVPGSDIAKDPKVTVVKDSEACWLFVKVEKSANFDSFMSYGMADGWTELTEGSGVYYREVAASTADQAFYVLKDNMVRVSSEVTKAMMTATGFTPPSLSFTAYAVQQAGLTVDQAWEQAQNLT